jgi:hypothetical protein
MNTIEFTIPWDNGRKTVKIVDVGSGSGGYQVLMDNYYNGDILFKGNEWVGLLNPKSELSIDDVQFLGSLVDEELAKENNHKDLQSG